MQQRYRIRANGHFRFVYRKGKHVSGKFFRLHYAKSRRLQVGFSVSKQVGKAVTRNLVKRRLREAFRARIPLLMNGSYVLTANPETAKAAYAELSAQLDAHLKRLGCFRSLP